MSLPLLLLVTLQTAVNSNTIVIKIEKAKYGLLIGNTYVFTCEYFVVLGQIATLLFGIVRHD